MINSRQEVQQYSDAKELISFKNDRGLESYMCALEDLRNIITNLNNVIERQGEINDLLNNSAIQYGTVTPENNVTSNNSQLYFNTSTSTMYTNPTIGVLTGWVAI